MTFRTMRTTIDDKVDDLIEIAKEDENSTELLPMLELVRVGLMCMVQIAQEMNEIKQIAQPRRPI